MDGTYFYTFDSEYKSLRIFYIRGDITKLLWQKSGFHLLLYIKKIIPIEIFINEDFLIYQIKVFFLIHESVGDSFIFSIQFLLNSHLL